jgi:hypothetical protein
MSAFAKSKSPCNVAGPRVQCQLSSGLDKAPHEFYGAMANKRRFQDAMTRALTEIIKWITELPEGRSTSPPHLRSNFCNN